MAEKDGSTMRTIFTNDDVKRIITNIFNSRHEKISITDENGNQTEKDIIEYLNVNFYSWKNRLVEKNSFYDNETLSTFEAWAASLNFSLNECHALVELTDSVVTPSQDIDSATLRGRITFLVQTEKAPILDYYILCLRNEFLGAPQDIQNSYGDIVKAYINLGILLYDSEPAMIQTGECIQVSVNFSIAYLTDSLNYNDTPMYLSIDGGTNYYQLPYSKSTWILIMTGEATPYQNLPNRTGTVNSSCSMTSTFTFYDFNKDLTKALNKKFWELGADYMIINSEYTPILAQPVNIPVRVRVVYDGTEYIYNYVLIKMEKDFSNSDFTVSTIILNPYGKIG